MDFQEEKKIGYSFLIFRNSKLDFMKYVIDFTQCERKFFVSIVLSKVFQLLYKPDCLYYCLDSWKLLFESNGTLLFLPQACVGRRR